ncbi:MAG: substrate-binding domain-containing protein, partial [Hyphomicrobiaceae bacterium]
VSMKPFEDRTVEHALLGSAELVLVANAPLAQSIMEQRGLGQALAETPCVSYDLDQSLIAQWLEYNDEELNSPRNVLTMPDLRCLRSIVRQGIGWSVLPQYLASEGLMTGELFAIPGPAGNPSMDYFLHWMRGALRSPRNVRAKQILLDRLTDQEVDDETAQFEDE